MKKPSAYQKLKKKNEELRQDIYQMLHGSMFEKQETEHKWRLIFDAETGLMFGEPFCKRIKEGKGIWDQIEFKK